MPSSTKDIHFRLPEYLWEELYRIFPEKGGRTRFFRLMAEEAVRLGPKSRFVKQVIERIEGDR